MDPNNNLTPGLTPDPTTPTTPTTPPAPTEPTAPLPTATPEPVAPDLTAQPNPAVDVANAAMNGATPVVTTTDPNAADVPAAPALSLNPSADPTAAPAEEGPVSLAPSAGFEMPEVSTVSALQNGADPNLAMTNDPLNSTPPEIGTPAPEEASGMAPEINSEMTSEPQADPLAAENPTNPEGGSPEQAAPVPPEEQEPIVAAPPVPGSIGSAKSYTDIQREEAAKAERAAALNGKKLKLSKNTILIIIIAAIAVIALGVSAFLIFGGSDSTPTPTTTVISDDDGGDGEDGVSSTLSCKRTLLEDEYVSFGAVSGTWENVFYFKDDVLNGLETNINYTYGSETTANQWKALLDTQYSSSSTSTDETEEPDTDAETDTETSGEKTTGQMLHHSISKDGLVVTHKMEVLSEDIEDWLASDAYSDVTYGAEQNSTNDVERNLDYYKDLQNNINYTCTISK